MVLNCTAGYNCYIFVQQFGQMIHKDYMYKICYLPHSSDNLNGRRDDRETHRSLV